MECESLSGGQRSGVFHSKNDFHIHPALCVSTCRRRGLMRSRSTLKHCLRSCRASFSRSWYAIADSVFVFFLVLILFFAALSARQKLFEKKDYKKALRLAEDILRTKPDHGGVSIACSLCFVLFCCRSDSGFFPPRDTRHEGSYPAHGEAKD